MSVLPFGTTNSSWWEMQKRRPLRGRRLQVSTIFSEIER